MPCLIKTKLKPIYKEQILLKLGVKSSKRYQPNQRLGESFDSLNPGVKLCQNAILKHRSFIIQVRHITLSWELVKLSLRIQWDKNCIRPKDSSYVVVAAD